MRHSKQPNSSEIQTEPKKCNEGYPTIPTMRHLIILNFTDQRSETHIFFQYLGAPILPQLPPIAQLITDHTRLDKDAALLTRPRQSDLDILIIRRCAVRSETVPASTHMLTSSCVRGPRKRDARGGDVASVEARTRITGLDGACGLDFLAVCAAAVTVGVVPIITVFEVVGG
jgi:hypothetical protein